MALLRIATFITLATASVFAQSNSAKLPDAPAGFTWKQLPEIKAAFLMPDSWYFKHENIDGTDAYFLTMEDIGKQGSFLTGLSINTVPNVSVKTKQWVKDYALLLHAQIKKDTTLTVVDEWQNPQAPFMVYGMRSERTVNVTLTVVSYQLVIANEKTDRLYVIVFESTKDLWEAAWRIGDVMMTKFVLDESV